MKRFILLFFLVSLLFFSLLVLANTMSAEETASATPTTELTSEAFAEEMANPVLVKEEDELVLPPPTDPAEEMAFKTEDVYITSEIVVVPLTKTVMAANK